MRNPQSVTVFHNKSHIKVCIVGNHYRTLAEFQESGQNLLDGRGVHYHTVINTGQLFNPKRNGNPGIYKSRKTLCDLAILYKHCSNFNDMTGQRGKACGFNIKYHKFPIQALSFTICNHTL